MTEFAPWAHGLATWFQDGSGITGTLMLKADAGLRLVAVEITHDGQGLVTTFEKLEQS